MKIENLRVIRIRAPTVFSYNSQGRIVRVVFDWGTLIVRIWSRDTIPVTGYPASYTGVVVYSGRVSPWWRRRVKWMDIVHILEGLPYWKPGSLLKEDSNGKQSSTRKNLRSSHSSELSTPE